GFILDHEGKKMSKSRGIVVDPWEVIDSQGADAMRWYFYTAGPPGDNKRFSTAMVADVVRKFWSTLWNTYSFLVTYANLDGWTPNSPRPAVEDRDLLDQWVLSELHQTIQTVTEAYDNYDAPNATRPVQAFVEALSNWYVRLGRRRFWKNEQDTDKAGAYATLYECLVAISHLIAPAMPFLSEAMYRNLVASDNDKAPPSIHLSQWPQVDAAIIRPALMDEMKLLRQLVSLGLAARNEAGIKVRQPLAGATFVLRPGVDPRTFETFADLVHSELNVKQTTFLPAAEAQNLIEEIVRINPLPQLLGKKFGKDFRQVQSAMREGKQEVLRNHAATLLAESPLNLQLDGKEFEVLPEEVEIHISSVAPEGYVMAAEGGCAALLDVRLDQALRDEGLAREVVRRVQNLRREANFQLNDRIAIRYQAEGNLAGAMIQFSDSICGETLCDEMEQGNINAEWLQAEFHIDSSRLLLGIKQL
ncbi:MAG: class I tRNA ligase family protein, partial [Anaerolineae bacterium]|nr:class I tRNA ligase family protein [Anaerolineae bacterium]